MCVCVTHSRLVSSRPSLSSVFQKIILLSTTTTSTGFLFFVAEIVQCFIAAFPG